MRITSWSPNRHAAAVGSGEASEHHQQSCFAGTGRAEQCQKFTAFDFQINMIKRVDISIGLNDLANMNGQGFDHSFSCRLCACSILQFGLNRGRGTPERSDRKTPVKSTAGSDLIFRQIRTRFPYQLLCHHVSVHFGCLFFPLGIPLLADRQKFGCVIGMGG